MVRPIGNRIGARARAGAAQTNRNSRKTDVAKEVYGKDTRLAMKPIKQKKRRYYALVFFVVFVLVGGSVGYVMYGKHVEQQKFIDAMAKMDEGLRLGDYASLDAAEKAVLERAKDNNPRVETVAYDIALRSWIWFAFTGEEVLMSDVRKYLAFLKEPLVDETGATFESPYKDEPMTFVADAVYKAVYDGQDEALEFLNKMDPSMLPAGQREFWIGVAHWRKGEWDAAEAAMKRAVEAADCPHHRFALARVLDVGGKPAEALAEYEKVLQGNPAHKGAEAYKMLLSIPEGADPVATIDGFIKKYEGQITPRIGSDLAIARANAQFLAGQTDKALSTIRTAQEQDAWYAPLRDWQPPTPPAPPEGEEGAEAGDAKPS
jgi:tetratricopeptide (TPR) repeat protein